MTEFEKLKRKFKKKIRSIKKSFNKTAVKAEIKADDAVKKIQAKKKVIDTKRDMKRPVKPKNNVVTINTAGFTKEQISELRQTVIGMRAENANRSSVQNPKQGEIYYTVSTDNCTIEEVLANSSSFDSFNAKIGNAFTTRYAAKLALEKQLIRTQLERFAEKHNGEIRPNHYYYIFMEEYNGNKILSVSEYSEKVQGAVCFSSDAVAEFAIKSLGVDRLKKLFY